MTAKVVALAAVVWLSEWGDTSRTTSGSDQIVGSGVIVTEARSVNHFTGVSVSGVGQVNLENTGNPVIAVNVSGTATVRPR